MVLPTPGLLPVPTHNCFVKGKTTQNVTRNGLYSVDSGTHTCNVTDALGCSGNASIDMNVMGKGTFMIVVTCQCIRISSYSNCMSCCALCSRGVTPNARMML